MPTIRIFNRDYQIQCGPGEEKKLLELAANLDKKIHKNAEIFKGANESLLIILTALLLEDQNADLQKKLEEKLNQASEKIEALCKLIEN